MTTLNAAHNHEEHAHKTLHEEVTNIAVKKVAKQEVQRLVTTKKIPKSWKSAPILKLGKTHYGDTNDWVVVFENLKIKKETKQKLYIFVNIHGTVVGTNYSGK